MSEVKTEVRFDVYTVDSCGDGRDRIAFDNEATALAVANALANNKATVVVYRVACTIRAKQQDAAVQHWQYDNDFAYQLVWYEGDCERLEVGGWVKYLPSHCRKC